MLDFLKILTSALSFISMFILFVFIYLRYELSYKKALISHFSLAFVMFIIFPIAV
jgi:hypothetical protein